jgi:hypothetical protein
MADEIATAPNAITKSDAPTNAEMTAPAPASAEISAVQTMFLGIGNTPIWAGSAHQTLGRVSKLNPTCFYGFACCSVGNAQLLGYCLNCQTIYIQLCCFFSDALTLHFYPSSLGL